VTVDIVPNRTSKAAIVLRENGREEGKVRTHPDEPVGLVRRASPRLAARVETRDARCTRRRVASDVLPAARARPSRPARHEESRYQQPVGVSTSWECSIVTVLTRYRVHNLKSNLAITRAWHATTLLSDLGVETVDEDDAYRTMDWLASVKDRTEAKLPARTPPLALPSP